MTPPIFHWLRRRAITALRVWLIAGIVLRVTGLRDRFDFLALVFYTTPWPVIAGGLALVCLHFAQRRDWHRARRYGAFTAVALFTWFALSWNSAAPSEQPPDVRVAAWNVARPGRRFDWVARSLRARDADILALAEAEQWPRLTGANWGAVFPGYAAEELGGGMVCLVRGEVLSRERGELDAGSYFGLLRVRIKGRELTVLQADIYARPLVSRRRPLARLAEIARAHAGENLIVLGDLNTPRDSVHFDPFRATFTDCFVSAGRGFAETWPMPLPVLSLDHAWVSGTVRTLACRRPWVWLSDHRPTVIDLAIKPAMRGR